jgi:NAD(P)-dependent dehydrogenase (short-subunit alcohol dehydrogenase family)
MMEKVVVVTGGGRGIGRATSLLAAERGYAVCINYVSDADAAHKTKAEIEAKGGKAMAVKADIAKEDDVVALFKAADALGPLKGLVNNAGMLPKFDRVENQTQAKLTRIFGINIFGPFLCAREAIHRMSTKHGGSGGAIVNVSSVAAHFGGAGRTVDYAATKAALEIFTVGLARELAEEGIRVNTVRPGPTETNMMVGPEQNNRAKDIIPQIPMKRLGQPREIAHPILWLLSDEASYVTATTIIASGGR